MCLGAKLLLLCLFTTLWTVAFQVPLSVEFSRQEFWSGLPCPPPGDLPNPGIKPTSVMSPALAGGYFTIGASLVARLVKNPPATWETWVRSLGWEDPLEKGNATHSKILAWRIPWNSMGLQRVGHDWATSLSLKYKFLITLNYTTELKFTDS